MNLKSSGVTLAVAAVGAGSLLSGLFANTAYGASLFSPVTQQQFQEWTHWAQKSVEILERQVKAIERKQKKDEEQQAQTGQGQGQSGPVNLENLGGAPSGTSTAAAAGGQGAGGQPKFETYFDLNLVNQPGTTESFNFDNYHSFVFFYLNPTPDITFSFNLLGPSTYPVFYELDWRASDVVTLRAGKIWIPFDDLSPQDPHNIFGGRDGIAQLMPILGNSPLLFLPSVWTELGVGARVMAIDNDFMQLQGDMTFTDGFAAGGTDPLNGGEYPSFQYTQPPSSPFAGTDNTGMNHRAKAIDLRAHALFNNVFGLGLTYYESQWNPDNDPNFTNHLNLYIVGQDAQVEFGGGYELRLGACEQLIYLPEGSTHRSGTYAELGVPIVPKWRFLVRGGTLDFDSRITGLTQSVAGGTILYNPGVVQFSLESSRALSTASAATGFTSYTDLRMIMLF